MKIFKSVFLFVLILFVPVLLVSCKTTRPNTVYINLNPEQKSVNDCSPHPEFSEFNIKKIAVMDFENSVQDSGGQFVPHPKFNLTPSDKNIFLAKNDGSIVAGVFERVLLSKYKYKIVERRNIERIIKEQQFAGSGYMEENGIAKIGKVTGADAILTGRVIDAYANFEVKTTGDQGAGGFLGTYLAYVTLEMKLVHVQTGEVVWFCVMKRNSMNYLNEPLSVNNYEILKDLHLFDKPLHGANPSDRIMYVLEQCVKEAVEKIL